MHVQRLPVIASGSGLAVCGRPDLLSDEQRAARASWPIALVAMPFALPTRPSLQVGLLAEIARSHGFPVDTLHLNLDFARRLGVERYHHVACTRNPMLGDWLFSVAAFGDTAPDPDGAMLDDLDPRSRDGLELTAMTPDQIRDLRARVVPEYLDDLMATIPWARYRAIGFTSTFQQNTPSFALARRIKEAHPSIAIVFGGANFDGPMGAAWMQSIPWIDVAISGEADHAFPLLLQRLCHGGDVTDIPGAIARVDGRISVGPPGVPLEDLDALPVPDFAEYFERAELLGLLPRSTARAVDIPFESSRGCWWAEKATCRFCGLNGSTKAYRAKSPTRVLDELKTLALRHHSLAFNASDNILSPDYLRSVIAPLAASDSDYWIFYEVKANLGRSDIRLLHQAGVRALQPGIESLSTHVLHLMLKGTTASQNVNLLRWARYYDIETYWNILFGFPGETETDYAEQARLARQLVHLRPPGGFVRIGLERFSPFFENADAFPVRGGSAVPEFGYTHTYPRHVDLRNAAYHFSGELEGSLHDDAYEPLKDIVRAWHDRWSKGARPTLTFWWSPGLLQIEDRRSRLSPATYRFEDPFAALYVACSDRPSDAAALRRRLNLSVSEESIAEALDEFCRRGLMMRDGALFLSLALPGTPGR